MNESHRVEQTKPTILPRTVDDILRSCPWYETSPMDVFVTQPSLDARPSLMRKAHRKYWAAWCCLYCSDDLDAASSSG